MRREIAELDAQFEETRRLRLPPFRNADGKRRRLGMLRWHLEELERETEAFSTSVEAGAPLTATQLEPRCYDYQFGDLPDYSPETLASVRVRMPSEVAADYFEFIGYDPSSTASSDAAQSSSSSNQSDQNTDAESLGTETEPLMDRTEQLMLAAAIQHDFAGMASAVMEQIAMNHDENSSSTPFARGTSSDQPEGWFLLGQRQLVQTRIQDEIRTTEQLIRTAIDSFERRHRVTRLRRLMFHLEQMQAEERAWRLILNSGRSLPESVLTEFRAYDAQLGDRDFAPGVQLPSHAVPPDDFMVHLVEPSSSEGTPQNRTPNRSTPPSSSSHFSHLAPGMQQYTPGVDSLDSLDGEEIGLIRGPTDAVVSPSASTPRQVSATPFQTLPSFIISGNTGSDSDSLSSTPSSPLRPS